MESYDALGLLHPKYQLPVTCFAYVGSVTHPSTWHLPYLDAEGEIDHSQLPKAILAVLTDYRGAHVSSIPEEAVPLVLQRLAAAARRAGRMPPDCPEAGPGIRAARSGPPPVRSALRRGPGSSAEVTWCQLAWRDLRTFLVWADRGRPASRRTPLSPQYAQPLL